MTDLILIPRELFAFLCGDGPLDGHWFGEKPEHERGNFWWRKALRAADNRMIDADTIKGIIRAWLALDDPSAWGDFEKALDAAISDPPTLQRLGQEFDAGEVSEGLREAIAATEYKYFGDYEMSDAQRKAVDVLVDHARASLALKADNRSSMERLGDILRGSSFKPTQKYLGAAFLGYDYARRYYAHPPQSRGQSFDSEGMIEAVKRFIADVDDGDRAEAGNNPLMAAHIVDLRAALSSAKRGEVG